MQVTDDRQDEQKSVFQAYKEAEWAIKAAFLPAPGKGLHPALQRYLQQQIILCPSADNNFPGCSTYLGGYSMYSWELSQTKHPQTYHHKKKSDLGFPKSAFGLPRQEDSETTTAIKTARENLPFFSQTCNNMSKADKISAVDKVSWVKYPSLVQKLSACPLIQCLVRKNNTNQ